MKSKKAYDVFISYRRNTGWQMARLLFERLKEEKLDIFLDVASLREGKFSSKLLKNIEETPNFILVLSEGSLDKKNSEEDWVLNEVTHAIKHNKNIIPVFLPGFQSPPELASAFKEAKENNGVKMDDQYFDAAIDKVLDKLVDVKLARRSHKTKRDGNTLYSNNDIEYELTRLIDQHILDKKVDGPIYQKIYNSYDQLYVLDVGCSKGDKIYDRFGTNPKTKFIMGIDGNESSVKFANEKFGKDNIKFYALDVTSLSFIDDLKKLRDENKVKFNVIHVSMLLLHLTNPATLLKSLYEVLEPDGTILIIDVDDTCVVASPDPNHLFEYAISIINDIGTAGERNTGRSIYYWLKSARFKDIKVENLILDTTSMNDQERRSYYDVEFAWLIDDLKKMTVEEPDNIKYKDWLNWLEDHNDELIYNFLSNFFYYAGSRVIITAKK